jgi:hypothetical protein
VAPKPTADFLVLSVQKSPSHPHPDICRHANFACQYIQGIYVTDEKTGDRFWLNVLRSGPQDLLKIKSGQIVTIKYEKDATDEIAFGGPIDEKQIVVRNPKRRKANVL